MKTLADIKKIAVLGAGTMGPGIAQTFAMGGYQVTMWTRSESTRDKAIASLQAQLSSKALLRGLPWRFSVKPLHFQCRGCGFEPWSGNDDPICHRVCQKKFF